MKRTLFLLILCCNLSYARINLQREFVYFKNNHETDITYIEPQYPSYITYNNYGLCLRACMDLPAGEVVGTNACTITDKEYIAGHESIEHRHSMVIGISDSGAVIYGRAWGKGAYINHSCDPNCTLIEGNIVTIRNVEKDEELTMAYDRYNALVSWDSKWNFNCLCGSYNCRGYIDSYKQS